MLPLSMPAATHSSCWETPSPESRISRIRYCKGRTPQPASTSWNPARAAVPTRDSKEARIGGRKAAWQRGQVSHAYMLWDTVTVGDSDPRRRPWAPTASTSRPGAAWSARRRTPIRDRAIEALAAASAEGRLTLEEYAQRSEAALVARTHGDLGGLTADLPAAPASAALAAPEQITAVLGNESRKGPWVVPPHLAVRSVLGDCHLEMQRGDHPAARHHHRRDGQVRDGDHLRARRDRGADDRPRRARGQVLAAAR